MSDRMTEIRDGEVLALGVEEATTIEGGKMVAVNSAGYAIEGADAAGARVLGVADHRVDNSAGADGAKTVRVRSGKVFKFKNSATNAVDQADLGTLVFVEDDETVADDPGTNGIVAGRCVGLESDGVLVQIPAGPQAAAVDDSAASDVATLKTDFNGLLASLRAAGILFNA